MNPNDPQEVGEALHRAHAAKTYSTVGPAKVGPACTPGYEVAAGGLRPTVPESPLSYSTPAGLSTELARLHARIEQLESYLEHTADGKLVCECVKLYCPHCSHEVRREFDLCYCEFCPNEDDGDFPHHPPLPMFYTMTLSEPKKPDQDKQP